MRDKEPPLYGRAAVRWLGRYCLEQPDAALSDLLLAAEAFEALPNHPGDTLGGQVGPRREVISKLVQPKAHTALNGPGWQAELFADFGVRQLPVEGERDHLLLGAREAGEQRVEAVDLGTLDDLVCHVIPGGAVVELLVTGSLARVPVVLALRIDSPVAHDAQ